MLEPKVLFGPYTLPAVLTGQKVTCRARDRLVTCGGLVECRIGPWPRLLKTGRPTLIVCGDLLRAIRKEAEITVAHWWGVSVSTVISWRRALGVGRVTPGTSQLLRANGEPWRESPECAEVLRANARDPEFRAKLSAERSGKAAPSQTREALLRAAKKKWTKARKQSRSEENRRRGVRVPVENPWTREEEELLGQTLDKHVAKQIGRTVAAVRSRRQLLGIPMSRHSRLHIGTFRNRKEQT